MPEQVDSMADTPVEDSTAEAASMEVEVAADAEQLNLQQTNARLEPGVGIPAQRFATCSDFGKIIRERRK